MRMPTQAVGEEFGAFAAVILKPWDLVMLSGIGTEPDLTVILVLLPESFIFSPSRLPVFPIRRRRRLCRPERVDLFLKCASCLLVQAGVPFGLLRYHDFSRPKGVIPAVPVLVARPQGFDRMRLPPVQMGLRRTVVWYYDRCLDASGGTWAESDSEWTRGRGRLGRGAGNEVARSFFIAPQNLV